MKYLVCVLVVVGIWIGVHMLSSQNDCDCNNGENCISIECDKEEGVCRLIQKCLCPNCQCENCVGEPNTQISLGKSGNRTVKEKEKAAEVGKDNGH